MRCHPRIGTIWTESSVGASPQSAASIRLALLSERSVFTDDSSADVVLSMAATSSRYE
jgi:hypothetical protein